MRLPEVCLRFKEAICYFIQKVLLSKSQEHFLPMLVLDQVSAAVYFTAHQIPKVKDQVRDVMSMMKSWITPQEEYVMRDA